MIHSIEQKTRKELVEIVDIQIKEYQELTRQLSMVKDQLAYLEDTGHEQQIKADGIHELLNSYKDHQKKTKDTNTLTLEAFARSQAEDLYIEADKLNGVEYVEEYYDPIRS